MIEDSEMVLRMDAIKREKMEIQKRIKQEIIRTREEEKIEANTEHDHVSILNQELPLISHIHPYSLKFINLTYNHK